MARRGIHFTRGEYYHIYNRGCNKENIFRARENYYYFLHLIKNNLGKFPASVIAYCLMPNHYHFLLRQDGDVSIGNLIQRVCNSYSKAFNKRYVRSGTLFEGPFKAKHVREVQYILGLCRYIHCNPKEAGLVGFPEEWEFSNYREWIGVRESVFIDKPFVQEWFGSPDAYITFINEYTPSSKENKKLNDYVFD